MSRIIGFIPESKPANTEKGTVKAETPETEKPAEKKPKEKD